MPEDDAAAWGATGPGMRRADADAADPAASSGRARAETEFLLAMRRTGSTLQLLGQVAAERIGINATDLNCLNIVALAGPMTAGELARQTGLTTGSITGGLDRLGGGGFGLRGGGPED